MVGTYEEFIQNIIDSRGRFGIPDSDENGRKIYKERHHIIPKCLGGTNDANNLVDLFAKEHFIAHQLLAKENPTNNNLLCAWWAMCQIKGRDYQERYIPTADEYEEARTAIALMESESRTGEKNPMFGRHIPMSEEAKEKLRQINLGRKHSKESKEKMRQSKLGRVLSEEHKRKIGESSKGKKHQGNRVYCVELERMFESTMEVERQLGIPNSNISEVCRKNGKRRTAGGYHWQYIKEE